MCWTRHGASRGGGSWNDAQTGGCGKKQRGCCCGARGAIAGQDRAKAAGSCEVAAVVTAVVIAVDAGVVAVVVVASGKASFVAAAGTLLILVATAV